MHGTPLYHPHNTELIVINVVDLRWKVYEGVLLLQCWPNLFEPKCFAKERTALLQKIAVKEFYSIDMLTYFGGIVTISITIVMTQYLELLLILNV